jgi:hypothetical protein
MIVSNLNLAKIFGWTRSKQTPGHWWSRPGSVSTEFLPDYTTSLDDIVPEVKARKADEWCLSWLKDRKLSTYEPYNLCVALVAFIEANP